MTNNDLTCLDLKASSRPGHITCIEATSSPMRTWCGRHLSAFEFVYVGTEHAVVTGKNKGKTVPCPDCTKMVIQHLIVGHSQEKWYPQLKTSIVEIK